MAEKMNELENDLTTLLEDISDLAMRLDIIITNTDFNMFIDADDVLHDGVLSYLQGALRKLDDSSDSVDEAIICIEEFKKENRFILEGGK